MSENSVGHEKTHFEGAKQKYAFTANVVLSSRELDSYSLVTELLFVGAWGSYSVMYREYCYPYNGNAGREKIIIGGGLVQIGFHRLASFDSTHITSITFAVFSRLFFVFIYFLYKWSICGTFLICKKISIRLFDLLYERFDKYH